MANLINEDLQKSGVGKVVELFMLDLSDVTGNAEDVFYFVEGTRNNSAILWKGKDGSTVTYQPIDIKISGFEFTSSGKLPRPKVQVSNITLSLLYYIKNYDDIIGAKLTRYVTLEKYLSPLNKDAHKYPDEYIFIQKTHQSPLYIEWELASVLDATGRKLPRRLILRDTCEWEYPSFNETTLKWEYGNAETVCPMWNFHLLDCDEFGRVVHNYPGWNWTTGNHWSFSNGRAYHSSGSGYAGSIYGKARTYSNCWYTVYFTIEYRTTGSMSIAFEGETGSGWFSTPGNYHATIKCPSDFGRLNLYANDTFNGAVSGIFGYRYLTSDGEYTGDPALDMCAKHLEACRSRWHQQALPFGGFPGVGRVRV